MKKLILGLLLLIGLSTRAQQIPFGKTADIPYIIHMDSVSNEVETVDNMKVTFSNGHATFMTDNAKMVVRIDSLSKILYPSKGITYYAYYAYNITLKIPCVMGFMWEDNHLNSVGLFKDNHLIVFALTNFRKNEL